MPPKKTHQKLAAILQSSGISLPQIDQKIDFELDKTHYKVIKLGAIANTIAGLFVVWMLSDKAPLMYLISWYAILAITNVFNIVWANYYENREVTPERLQTWRSGMHFIVASICIVWGSIGILFYSNQALYQLYIITFLQVVVLAFAFSTVVDFTTTAVSLSCLVVPTAVYRFYLSLTAHLNNSSDVAINFAFGISLLILGIFLVAAAFIANRLLRKAIRLSFENLELNIQLENANRFLEERVKERTVELEKSLQLVTYQATHDLLTNLPNQRLLLEYMQTAMDSAINNSHQIAVACFTLNEIEKINDGLGHKVGDAIIKIIAQRFQNLFSAMSINSDQPTKYTVTLTRKDVFVILMDPIRVEEIEDKCQFLFKIMEDPIFIEKQNIILTASIGVSLYPQDGGDVDKILMNADAAMIQAKQRGGNALKVYHSEINASIYKQIEIESKLHQAVKDNEFFLHYQPLIDLNTDTIVGAEALTRWRNQVLGLVPPDEFIPIAEANGLIIPIGDWLMRTSCQQLKVWHTHGYPKMKMAINLSSKQLHQRNFLDHVLAIIREAQLNPECVELELTEREAFQAELIPILKTIHEHGLGLSIDDFGTGYSGLSSLKLFPISKIK